MTLIDLVVNYFTKIFTPVFIGVLFYYMGVIVITPSIFNIIFLIFLIYIVPVLIYRLIALYYPIQNGFSSLAKENGLNGWVVAHRLQSLYYNIEIFERLLRLIPNAYSAWLRMWGSEIGENVYWTPHTKVGDRTHLRIGSNVLIGNASYLSPHVVKKSLDKKSLMVLIEPIVIGDNAIVGTHSVLGPGSEIKSGQDIPPFAVVHRGKVQKMELINV